MKHPLTSFVLAAALLAGCAPSYTATNAQALASKASLGAKGLTFRDVNAIIAAAAAEESPQVVAGLPAILKATSDVAAQRGLNNLYEGAVQRALAGVDKDVDEALWQSQIPGYLASMPLVTKPEVQAYVQGIADRLCKAVGATPFKVFVVETPMVNAFNAGGHAMVLFTGLVLEVKDEAELSGVMAHEMSHGLLRHALEGMTMRRSAMAMESQVEKQFPVPAGESELADAFMLTLPVYQQNDQDFVLSYLQGKVGAGMMTRVQFGLNDYFTMMGMTRSREAAADAAGVRNISRAGYDPFGMVRVFERWNTRAPGDTRYYSHPDLGARAGALKGQIAREGLKGDDTGADRLAAIQALLKPSNPGGGTEIPATAASAGCFQPVPLKSWRNATR